MLNCDKTRTVVHARGVLVFCLGREIAKGDMYIRCLTVGM